VNLPGGSGFIDASELQSALMKLGLPSSDDYVTEVMLQYDDDRDGVISFKEYHAYVTKQAGAYTRPLFSST